MKNKKIKIITSLMICAIFLAPTMLQLEAHNEIVEYRRAEYQKIIDQINTFLQQRKQLIGYPKLVRELAPREDVTMKEEDGLVPGIFTGTIEDENTVFSITNSSYLNITITSTETVYMLLESVPRVISYLIKPVNEAVSSILTITGLESGKTYYRYQEGHLIESLVADESGEYSYNQEIEREHHVYFLDVTSTIYIREDGSIEGTTNIIKQGDVYEIKNDIQDFIIVERKNTTIEGNGHLLQGSNTGYGIYSCYIDNIDVRNLRIENFSYGINFILSSNHKVSNCKFANIAQTAIYLSDIEGNSEIIDNEITDSLIPLQCRGKNGLKISVLNNKIKNCRTMSIQEVANSTISKNNFWRTDRDRVTGMSIGNIKHSEITYNNITNGYYGISLSESDQNIIDNTNIISHNFVNYTLYGMQLFGGTNTIVCDNQFEEVFYGVWIRPYHNILDSNQLVGLPLRNVVVENNKIYGTDVGIQFQITGNIIAYSENVSIRNNEFTNGDWGINVYGNIDESLKTINYIEGNTIINHYCGIQLKDNNLIVNNNLISFTKHAFNIEKGSNTTIQSNIIRDTEFYGIKLQSSTKNNIIEWNSFYNSNLGGSSQGLDDGINNIFRFNFWNDWTSPDENHDGYVDIPYPIEGLVDNFDYYPLRYPNILDSDNDGIEDELEVLYYGTDKLDPDSDDDELSDGEEIYEYDTDPNNRDTDGDSFSDGLEVEKFWDPLDPTIPFFDPNADTDRDELLDAEEIIYNTDPFDDDTDNDGLTDGEEVKYVLDSSIEWENGYGTDPLNPDTDGDLIPDGEEVDYWKTQYYIDWNDFSNWFEDYDGDSIINLLDSDSDNDGIDDGLELENYWNPRDNESPSLEIDFDGDGLTNYEERFFYYTDPSNPDTDLDGLLDGEEVYGYYGASFIEGYGTDPLLYDSDFDGISDGAEVSFWNIEYEQIYGNEVTWYDDYDNDNLINILDSDSDNDGFLDGIEIELLYCDPRNEFLPSISDDIDNDGLTNAEEIDLGTDFCNSDTDSDGLLDGEEVFGNYGTSEINGYGTNPLIYDSDFDGISDGEEVEYWLLGYSEAGFGNTEWYSDNDFDGMFNLIDPDSDNDGFLDGLEISCGWNPLNPNSPDIFADPDDDGLDNQAEAMLGTDPLNPDTDSDGLLDGEEARFVGDGSIAGETGYGTDPLIFDTDGDLIPDGEEVDYWNSQYNSNWYEDYDGDFIINLLDQDSDNDGISDGLELSNNWNPRNYYDPADEIDSDNDGLTNLEEIEQYFTDPNNPDTDSDGLLDGEEVSGNYGTLEINGYGTDPLLCDSDSDGISDGAEVIFWNVEYEQIYSSTTEWCEDYDSDGLVNLIDPDSDNDGFLDGIEILYEQCDPRNEWIPSSDHDFDQDGIANGEEIILGTDPFNIDTDNDGLTDYEELYGEYGTSAIIGYGTDPLLPDTDFDGITDGEEVEYWEDIHHYIYNDWTDWYLDYDNDGLANLIDSDSDNDGFLDGLEISCEWNPLDSNSPDGFSDPDEDGLNNQAEALLGTDPFNPDTDGDGLTDGEEVLFVNDGSVEGQDGYGTNPLDPDSDNDGISDGAEVCFWNIDYEERWFGTPYWYSDYDEDSIINLHDVDSDNDGFTDGYEINHNWNPLDYDDPIKPDTDEDGLNDYYELIIGTDPNDEDSDDDNLEDGLEVRFLHTNPLNPDTDNDGIPDGEEKTLWEIHSIDPIGDIDQDGLVNILDPDSDNDGMPDGWEDNFGLYPAFNDAEEDRDGDSLCNYDEYLEGTDPRDSDTDDDLLLDGWEVENNLNPLLDDSTLDHDNDNLNNYDEFIIGTDPWKIDTDGDLLKDWDELYKYFTNPLVSDSNFDTDKDGLTNVDEVDVYETNPLDSDTDNDGLEDGEEIDIYDTDPLDDDSDDDTILDGEEVEKGADGYITDPNDSDTDKDGLDDAEELKPGIDGHVTDPTNEDSDFDFLLDGEEYSYNTNPLIEDTDGDNFLDGNETEYWLQFPFGPLADLDNDGIPNIRDPDSDGDSLWDGNEYYGLLIRDYESYPYRKDSDYDGIFDNVEISLYMNGYITDPMNPDTDGDGLTDYAEIYDLTYQTNPENPDTDNDGLDDKEEFDFWTLEYLFANPDGDAYYNNLRDPDSDNDGMLDGEEYDYWLSIDYLHCTPFGDIDFDGVPNMLDNDSDGDQLIDGRELDCYYGDDSLPYKYDSDNDRLSDHLEITFGSDPMVFDTDGDGVNDRYEYLYGTDPNNPVDTWVDENDDDVPITNDETSVTIIFEDITSAGVTTIESSTFGPDIPENFKINGLYISISTTAGFEDGIIISIPYFWIIGTPIPVFYHYVQTTNGYEWVPLATSYDFLNHVLYCTTHSLSFFALMFRDNIGSTYYDLSNYYIDINNTTFVSSESTISIYENVTIPYFSQVLFRINGGDWQEYLHSFSLSGANGEYLIEFYGIDYLGNTEEIKSFTVTLTNPDISSYFTECEDSYFDVIFRKANDGTYQYVTTNPGVFIYRIEILNNWPLALDNLTYTFTLPEDFAFSGTNPIHVYLDGLDITPDCIIDGSTVTIFNIPAESLAMIELHLLFAPEQTNYASLDDFVLKNYQFNNSFIASAGALSILGFGLTGSYSSTNSLVAHQKKTTAIAGYVFSSDSTPIGGALIELYDSAGCLVASTSTDDAGFFYFLDLSSGEFSLKVIYDGLTNLEPVTTIKDNVVIVNIILN
ncbi:MAG: hypothetical protein EAX90_03555 [Candidatus Heimdallarchaeota archaeon]|nr:hypothetical protein [Candidatus Heimdallarchaeota archaeon]